MKKMTATLLALLLLVSASLFSACSDQTVQPPEDPAADPSSETSNADLPSPDDADPSDDADSSGDASSDTASGVTPQSPQKDTYGPVTDDGVLQYRLVNDAFYEVYGVCGDRETVTEIEIPATFEGKPVQRIRGRSGYYTDQAAFASCYALRKLTIPEGVTKIGEKAFYQCRALEEISLPTNLEMLGKIPFEGCGALQRIMIGDAVNGECAACRVVDGVLFTADGETLIQYPAMREGESYAIPEGVKTVADTAFMESAYLTQITTPESLGKIRSFAFSYGKVLKSVSIAKNVTSIDNTAFIVCGQLSAIQVDEENSDYCSIDGVLFSKNKAVLFCYPAGRQDRAYHIPQGVVSIKENGFYNVPALKALYLPESMEMLASYSIFCDSLEQLYLPAGTWVAADNAVSSKAPFTVYCGRAETSPGWAAKWIAGEVTFHWNYRE